MNMIKSQDVIGSLQQLIIVNEYDLLVWNNLFMRCSLFLCQINSLEVKIHNYRCLIFINHLIISYKN